MLLLLSLIETGRFLKSCLAGLSVKVTHSVCLCVRLMMCKDVCMEMCIFKSLWLFSAIVCVCVSMIVWNVPTLCCCVWLCAQTRWLVADNNTRGRVFVDLFAEEIPTVLSVSGLCVFLGLHAWLRQLFYSPVGPLNPARPTSLVDPSFSQRPALHLIRATLAKPSAELLRAPQSCSMLTIRPPSPPHSHHLHVKTAGLISSSLELWHTSQLSVCVCVTGLESELHVWQHRITSE